MGWGPSMVEIRFSRQVALRNGKGASREERAMAGRPVSPTLSGRFAPVAGSACGAQSAWPRTKTAAVKKDPIR